jgi:dipeptidyl aminopeptidase/acylaminoacyl peptidase
MQDDITDGVEWLIRQGYVDKDRICLYGGSYGGYATLWSLIKTPDLYKCGVAFVAVTDINLMFDIAWSDMARSSYGWLDYGARDLIGDPDKDAEKFRSVSPLVNAEKLKAPVLLAYGASDIRVPLKHGQEFRAALDKYGKTYEWVVYNNEAHGFNKDENRFDFFRRVDAFLKKYLQ